MLTLTPKELSAILQKNPTSIDLIDVRGTGEYAEVHIPEARNIPLHLLPMRLAELNTSKQIIFICRSGGRSGQACNFAESANIKSYNLIWGMNDFESSFPTQVVQGEKKKLFGLF